MKTKISCVFLALLLLALLYACTAQNSASAPPVAPATEPVRFALFGPPPHRSGVELWSVNCARCHNMRPPGEFSPQQWSAIVVHMRLRADLTGQEQREIVAFLKSAR